MLAKRLIKSNDAGGGACTNTVDLYNPFPDGGGVALYQLNGDATDVSGNYDGTATNVTYGAGQFGQAGVFNGSTSVVSLGNVFNSTLSNNFTISAWVNVNSMGGQIFGKGLWATGGEYVRFYTRTSTPRIQFGFEDGSGNNVFMSSNSENLEGTGWRHIVAVGDYSGSFSLYLDGQHIESQTINGSMNMTNSNSAYIGNRESNNAPFNGSIDQVRIFSRALRPYEVEALYTEEYCTPTIVPSEHFNTVLYTGSGSDGLAVTGTGFSPDFVWIKPRTQADNHNIYDTLRGVRQQLITNNTSAESTQPRTLQSFDADGFTLNDDNNVNNSGIDYVAWNFKAGGAAVTNTDGTITSQVSANTEAGFSIVTFTGDGSGLTVGHGLGIAPKITIRKKRNGTSGWDFIYDGSIVGDSGLKFMQLNSTAAQQVAGQQPHTDTTFGLYPGYDNVLNQTWIAYCFAEVEGFSNFGSYVGTGASGNTVVTGFEPAFVMIKRTDSTGNWFMLDNKRDNTNPNNLFLLANAADTEKDLQTTDALDFVNFLENGFEVLNGGAFCNASGGKYIYMAFAADPTAVEPTLEDSFNTVLYTGDAGNTGNTLSQTVTGVGFQPDLVWGKNRDYANNHILFDSVRSPEKWLSSNNTNAESESIYTQATILSDGFTTGTADALNRPNNDFVAWCWKGAELPAINSNGSIPSVVSANPAAGFSIVSYTGNSIIGSTVGHGLNAAPDVVIIKGRQDGLPQYFASWGVYHSSLGATQRLWMNNTEAAQTAGGGDWINNTEPTDSVFTVGEYYTNWTGRDFIAYCFAEVAGFSKFGSYTGNGSTSGQTIEVGFEPAFLIIKSTSQASDWFMWDNKRSPTNERDNRLKANTSDAETISTNGINFDSTSFRMSGENFNNLNRDFIYMAFANQF